MGFGEERWELGDRRMPGWRVHRFLDRMFYGKAYSKIHSKMDSAVVILGKRHRILFHNPLWVCAIAEEAYPGDPNAVASGNMHILADQTCSAYPDFKKMLENMEMADRKNRRKRRKTVKKAPKKDDVLSKLYNDMKKIEEIRRIFRDFCS